MAIIAKPTATASSSDVAKFCDLVRMGGEVEVRGLLGRVANEARTLVFDYRGPALVGVGALKDRPPDYRRRVFARAGSAAVASEFPHELGWVVVAEGWRGKRVSYGLVEAIMSFAEGRGAYATVRIDNEPMRRTLARFGFQSLGDSYPSIEHPGSKIGLLISRPIPS